jgi:segregation and condensation protein B
MSIKAKIEAIIYAAEEPIAFEQILALVKDEVRQEITNARSATTTGADAAGTSDMPEVAGTEPANDAADQPLASTPAADSGVAGEEPPAASAGLEAESQPPTAAFGGELPPDYQAVPSVPEYPDEASSTAGADGPAAEPGPVTDAEVRMAVRTALSDLVAVYSSSEHGIEVRQIAGGYRMATKPEQHDLVRSFAKSLKPPIRLSLPALETLAVIAYKQPVTAPEIAEIRGVDTGGVLGTLLDRKLITTAGRKQVIGRPILYKTTKEFLLRFGLKNLEELPSMEEFEKLAAESFGADLFVAPAASEPAAAPSPSTPELTFDNEVEPTVKPESCVEPEAQAQSVTGPATDQGAAPEATRKEVLPESAAGEDAGG